MANILIVYAINYYPLRATTRSLLESYKKYSGNRCFYLNAAFFRLTFFLKKVPFDLILFDYTFFDARWDRDAFRACAEKVRALESSPAPKIALVQDEFMNMDLVVDFVRRSSITHVFSLASPSEQRKIYASLDFNQVKFHRVLPGYLDESLIPKLNRMQKEIQSRPIDIGYRTAQPWPAAGRFNQIKGKIAECLMKKGNGNGLVVDCRLGAEHFFLEEEWYRFLLKCKYTVSVEGGAGILDRDGSLMERTKRYLKEHPGAGFEEVERECFPGRDGELELRSISPRHLEACATRTCQILVEGSYNGVLKPGEHYLELKKDMSNFDAILDTLKDDGLRVRIVEKAYRDIVESGRYSYRRFVEFVLDRALGDKATDKPATATYSAAYVMAYVMDALCYFRLWVYFTMLKFTKKTLPRPVWAILKSAKMRLKES